MSIDTKLVKKGLTVTREGLVVQAQAHLELEKRHRPALAAVGWTTAMTTSLAEGIALINSERAAALDARLASRANREREVAAVARAKALKRRLMAAFDDLHADKAVGADERQVVIGRGTLNHNTTRILAYLVDIEGVVSAADAKLAPYFGGASAAAEVIATRKELEGANAVQEVDYAKLPRETQKIYEAKGYTLSLIEKMNRLAKIAFQDDEATLALFNKDLIKRARKTRAAAPKAAPADTGPATE